MFFEGSNGVKLSYEVVGEGIPVLVIHGFYTDHRSMSTFLEPIFNVLTENVEYKRYYIDLPGMGESPSLDCAANVDNVLEAILEFIKRLVIYKCSNTDVNEKFVLIAQSYGCYISRGIVSKISELIQSLVYVCPVIISEKEKRILPPQLFLEDEKILEDEHPKLLESFDKLAVIRTKENYDIYKEQIGKGFLSCDLKFLARFRNHGYKLQEDNDVVFESFKGRCMFLLGRQDYLAGYEDAMSIVSGYPRASIFIIDGAGHNLHIEKNHMVFEFILEFLA